MKKLLMIAILMLALVVTAVACTNNPDPIESTDGETTADVAPDTTDEPEDTTAELEITTEEITTEEVTTEKVTTEEATTEEVTTEEVTTEEVTTEEVTTEEVTTEEVTTEEVTTEEVTTEPPVPVVKPYTNCNHHDVYVPENMLDDDESTFFWTAGNLNTAAGGENGYFGLDLGEVKTVNNIYISMGAGGSDYLKKGILEYSVDGKAWEIIYQGEMTPAYLKEELSIQARYIRMRSDVPADDTTWIKISTFGVNVEIPKVSASTNMNIYDTNTADCLVDDDPNTIFWSTGHGGDPYVQLDLGEITSVSHVKVVSGNLLGNDKIASGQLCYSVDGETWTNIDATFNEGIIDVDVDVQVCYIRLNIVSDPGAWVAISEFSVAT